MKKVYDSIESPYDYLLYSKVKHYPQSELRKRKIIAHGDRFHITSAVMKDFGLKTPTDYRFKKALGLLKGASGVTIKELAWSIMMSTGYVSDLLRGKNKPDMCIIERIAHFFGLSPEHFMEYRLGLLIRELGKCPVMIKVFLDILSNEKFNVKK